jgi:hypothetical protein
MSSRKPTLHWTKINDTTAVAAYGEVTFVLSRNRHAGKSPVYNLSIVFANEDPLLLGRELPRSHCLQIVNGWYQGEVCDNLPRSTLLDECTFRRIQLRAAEQIAELAIGIGRVRLTTTPKSELFETARDNFKYGSEKLAQIGREKQEAYNAKLARKKAA